MCQTGKRHASFVEDADGLCCVVRDGLQRRNQEIRNRVNAFCDYLHRWPRYATNISANDERQARDGINQRHDERQSTSMASLHLSLFHTSRQLVIRHSNLSSSLHLLQSIQECLRGLLSVPLRIVLRPSP